MIAPLRRLVSARDLLALPLAFGALAGCAEAEEAAAGFIDTLTPPALAPEAGAGDAGVSSFDASFQLPPGFTFPDAALTADSGSIATPEGGVRSDASVGDASAGDARVGDASVPPPSSDLCHLDGNQVGIMGDSYIQLSGDFTRYLQESARKAGALGANDKYLDHSLSAASMDGFPSIPEQWPNIVAQAKSLNSKGVKLLIMTGGGNDVLVNNRHCLDFTSVSAVNDACKKVVQTALDRSQEVFDQAVKDGLKAIIFFFYPHLPPHFINGPHPNNMLDYAYPLVKQQCEKQTAIPCYFVDTRPSFDNGKGDGYPKDGLISAVDGIHPTPEGSKIISDLVWKVMQDKCLASK